MSTKKVDLQKLQQEVNSWVSSKTGQKALQESVKKAEDVTSKLQEVRQVSLEIINKPFTV